MAKSSTKQEPSILEIDGIPTPAGLARKSRDLAYIRADGKYHVTPAGHAEMGDALRARGRERLARGEGKWEQPPSSGKERTN